MTGNIEFDENGFRKNYKFDVYNVGLQYGPEKVYRLRFIKEYIFVQASGNQTSGFRLFWLDIFFQCLNELCFMDLAISGQLLMYIFLNFFDQ